LGTFLVVWALVLLFSNVSLVLIATITTAYIFIGATLEERKLVDIFGAAYQKYQQDVPMLFPFNAF